MKPRGGRGRDRFPLGNIGAGAVPAPDLDRPQEALDRRLVNFQRLDLLSYFAAVIRFTGSRYEVELYRPAQNLRRVVLEAIGIDYDRPEGWGTAQFQLWLTKTTMRTWQQVGAENFPATALGAVAVVPAYTPMQVGSPLYSCDEPYRIATEIPPNLALVGVWRFRTGGPLTNLQAIGVRARVIIREEA